MGRKTTKIASSIYNLESSINYFEKKMIKILLRKKLRIILLKLKVNLILKIMIY